MAATILLVGCGKMGGALVGGWLDRGMDAGLITVVEPEAANTEAFADLGAAIVLTEADLAADYSPDIVIFAVKPQAMDAAVPAYRRFADGGAMFMSIAAGKPIAYFEEKLGPTAAICRAMPNMPAAVRRGITVLTANAAVNDMARQICADLMAAVGDVAWIEDEDLMDAVTAVSGSGPAYVFLLAECLALAAVEAGLPETLAERLAHATVSGAGELMYQSADPPALLRQHVTSPGGTTEAALAVLMAEPGMAGLLLRAVAEAQRRSRELAG